MEFERHAAKEYDKRGDDEEQDSMLNESRFSMRSSQQDLQRKSLAAASKDPKNQINALLGQNNK